MKEKTILRIKNTSTFQELDAYYGRYTIFSALGIERNEMRHSAFLSWLLNPNSDHLLSDEPLKKFLALYVSVNETVDAQLRAALITGRFEIESVETGTEVPLSRFTGEAKDLFVKKEQNRLDIWMEIKIMLSDATNSETIALVIENKIYSVEGETNGVSQTDVYHNYLSQYYAGQTLFEVFLTPDDKKAICPTFVHLSYQQLLDFVLQPVSQLITSKRTKMFVDDYIRNLGRAALDEDEKKKTYSILAISPYERKQLEELLNVEGMKDILDGCLYAVFGNQAKKILGTESWEKQCELTTSDVVLLTEFWNANTGILKAMLHTLSIYPGSEKDVDVFFKENNRDNTKFFVEREDNGRWVPADKNFNNALAKGRAVCVFFTNWMRMHEEQFTIEEVRKAFPISINKYYDNSKWDFIDTLIFTSYNRVGKPQIVNKAGKEIALEDNNWDFYPLYGRQCGWGYLKNHERAIMPKMWRKDDFQLLLEHINKNPELFSGLRIRQA